MWNKIAKPAYRNTVSGRIPCRNCAKNREMLRKAVPTVLIRNAQRFGIVIPFMLQLTAPQNVSIQTAIASKHA